MAASALVVMPVGKPAVPAPARREPILA